jgi:hypothetical protein
VIALVLCVLALISSHLAGRRSLTAGLLTTLAWAYFYGILRANFATAASHFIFDCSMVGFYTTQGKILLNSIKRTRTLHLWATALFLWPCIVCFFPFQPFLVSLVGLRGNVFFLPMLLIGAELTSERATSVARGLALLNVIALAFACAEYQLGVPRFYPVNSVTRIIYASHDVGGFRYFRIPATFNTAHAYAGAMVTTIPLLFGALVKPVAAGKDRVVALVGIVAALLGVLLSSTRVHFVFAGVLCVVILLSGELTLRARVPMIAVFAVLALVAANNSRMSRFKSLGNSEGVSERIGGSVNATVWDAIRDHPMGNGLGGGGTSIPYFLEGEVRNPMVIENDFGRIALELGVIGLLLWLAFIVWFVTSSAAFTQAEWRGGRRVAWVCVMCYWVNSLIGLGTLTAIPQTVTFLLMMGWVAVREKGSEIHKISHPPTRLEYSELPVSA